MYDIGNALSTYACTCTVVAVILAQMEYLHVLEVEISLGKLCGNYVCEFLQVVSNLA